MIIRILETGMTSLVAVVTIGLVVMRIMMRKSATEHADTETGRSLSDVLKICRIITEIAAITSLVLLLTLLFGWEGLL